MVGAVHVAPDHFQRPPSPPPGGGRFFSHRVQPYERWAHAEAVLAKATAVARRVVKTVVPGKVAAGLLSGPAGPVPLLPPRMPPPLPAFRSRGSPRGRTLPPPPPPPRRSAARTQPRSSSTTPPREKSLTPRNPQQPPQGTTASSHTLAKSEADRGETTAAPLRMRVPGYSPPPTTVLYASTLTQARNPPHLNIRPPALSRGKAAGYINFSGRKEYFYGIPDIIKEPATVLHALEKRSRRRESVISDLSSQDVLTPPPLRLSSQIPIPNSSTASSAPAVITHSGKPSPDAPRDPKEVLRSAYKHYMNKAKTLRDAQGLMLDLAWREQERDGTRDRGSSELERLRRKLREPPVVKEDTKTVDNDSQSNKPLVAFYHSTTTKRCPSDRSNESSQDSRHSMAERTPAKGALKLGVPKDSELRISGRKKSVHIVTPPKTPLRASSSTMGIDSSMLHPPKTKRFMTPLQATPPRYKTPSIGKDVREEDVDKVLQKMNRDKRSTIVTPSDPLHIGDQKSARRRMPTSPGSSRSHTRRLLSPTLHPSPPLPRTTAPQHYPGAAPPSRAVPPFTAPPPPLRRPVTPRLVLPSTTTMRRTPHYAATRSRYSKFRDR